MRHFEEGHLLIAPNQEEQVFIDIYGHKVLKGDEKLHYLDGFHEGRAPVRCEGKKGYIDLQGRLVIAPRFDEVSPFHNGFACVRLNDEWAYINRKGEMIGRCEQ